MPLTPAERISVRHHMGYLNVGEAYTFVLGSPASVETTFVIEGAMDRVLEDALPLVRRILASLDSVECQMLENSENQAVEGVGDIRINARAQAQFRSTYDYWVAALANVFGVPRNPFDKRLSAVSGINVRVAG
jgi:hypothetical protein